MDVRKNGYIITQDITSRDLVTLEELCNQLHIQPVNVVPSACGGFNDTYFTRYNRNLESKIAIRVSRDPVAEYTEYPGEINQTYLRWSGTGVNDERMKQIQEEWDKYKPSDRERMKPLERKPGYTTPTIPNLTSLHRQEIEGGEFLIELETSKRNWLESSRKGLCPTIIYYGFVEEMSKRVGLSRGVDYQIRSCIISEKYSMDLKGFYKDLVMTDKCSEEQRESINQKVLEEVQAMIRGLVELSIICADIKPANMVVKYNTRTDGKIDVNSIEVRLIDLDGDWCTRMENGIAYNQTLRRSLRIMEAEHEKKEREHKENIELLMLLVLGFHFDKFVEYNPFTAHFKAVFKQKGSSPDELYEMLREHTTIQLIEINETTDLSLLPLNETYDHYFSNREQSDDGTIFKDLCKRIRNPYEPSPSVPLPPPPSVPLPPPLSSKRRRSLSPNPVPLKRVGGKKQKTISYKGNKKNYRSSKRKTMKNHKI